MQYRTPWHVQTALYRLFRPPQTALSWYSWPVDAALCWGSWLVKTALYWCFRHVQTALNLCMVRPDFEFNRLKTSHKLAPEQLFFCQHHLWSYSRVISNIVETFLSFPFREKHESLNVLKIRRIPAGVYNNKQTRRGYTYCPVASFRPPEKNRIQISLGRLKWCSTSLPSSFIP